MKIKIIEQKLNKLSNVEKAVNEFCENVNVIDILIIKDKLLYDTEQIIFIIKYTE